MFTIAGRARSGYCDGVTRRDFLKIGGLALGGMSLPQLLRAEDQAGITRSHKAVIMVFLAGGPPHQDMFDLKPDAPEGIRGEYRPIATNVPGLEICEHMPRLAKMMDRFAVIRSVVGAGGDHSAGQCLTGYKDLVSKAQGGRPSLGAIVSHLQGPVHPDVPPFVGLSPRTGEPRWGNPGDPGYLGLAHAPFTPFRTEAKPKRNSKQAPGDVGLSLDDKAITPQRLAGRARSWGKLTTSGTSSITMTRRWAWTASPSGPLRCSHHAGFSRRRPVEGRSQLREQLWNRRHDQRGRRPSLLHGPLFDGPAAGRSGREW